MPEEIKYYWRHEAEHKITEAIGKSKLASDALEKIIKGEPEANHQHYFGKSQIDFAVDPAKRNSDKHFDVAMTQLLDEIPTIEKVEIEEDVTVWKLRRETSDPAVSLLVTISRHSEPFRYPDDPPADMFERVFYDLSFDPERAEK
jgi:hypothetical protein